MVDNPPQRSPMQVPETWDTVAPGYAEEAQKHAEHYSREALRRVPIESGARVLDIATGPGTLAFLAAETAAHVVAVDFSPGMIDELVARARATGVSNVEGRVMDARNLEVPDGSFDVVYCMFAFMFFPDRAKVFSECHRVLRPGGHLMIGTWAPIDRRPLMKLGFDAMAEALPSAPPPQKGDLQSPAECVREMTDAGFSDVESLPFSASWLVESAEQYVGFMERSGAPLAMLRKKFGPDAWEEIQRKLVDGVRSRLPQGRAELSAEALLTCGTRAK
jgi:ubiquinone/menaquinone biosynthesis C-methylase UbiE